MNTYIVTVSKIDGDAKDGAREIYRQAIDELDLAKFVVALNKTPRVRRAKAPKKVEAGT
jgi:hypothetical protein